MLAIYIYMSDYRFDERTCALTKKIEIFTLFKHSQTLFNVFQKSRERLRFSQFNSKTLKIYIVKGGFLKNL